MALLLACAWAGDLRGGALYLDGNASYVTFAGTGIPSGGQSFTIEAWINPTTIPTGGENGGQITFWGNQTANQANGFRLRGPSGVRHYFWGNDHDANFGMDILPDTTGPNHDGWHHLALTYNGSQTVWYWNGSPIGTRTTAAGVAVVASNHRIGSRLGAEYFHGYLDEIRVWSRAKSGTEIAADLAHSLGGTESGLVAYFDFEGDLADRAGGDNNGTAAGNAVVHPSANAPISTTGPRIYAFTASTNWVVIGTPVTLSWQVTNATLLVIDHGVGIVDGLTNSVSVTPLQTTTYTLTASNAFGVRTALANVQVDPGAPVATPMTVATIKNTPVAVTLAGTDPNGGTLTFATVTLPQHGQLTGSPPHLLYTPATDYFGTDFFTFKANDGTHDSAPATVSIRIEAEPTPPTQILLSSTNVNSLAGPGTFLAALRAVDANPLDTHTFTLVAGAGDTDNALFTTSSNLLLAGPGYAPVPGTDLFIRLRATDNAGLTVDAAVVLRVVEIALNVVINEIHYNGANNTVFDEFIELHNPKAGAVDLSDWRLRGGVDFHFPAGTTIPPGGFLVVAQNPAVVQSVYGVAALGPWDGLLASEGERVTLRDPLDRVVDEVDFRAEFPWPIAADGEGPSMELIHPSLDNDLGSSWRAPLSPARPSPGAMNQVWAFNVAPNIRQVNHVPERPNSAQQVVVSAKVTDPEGVASVQLHYQWLTPGGFIPATVPLTTAQLNSLNSNPTLTNSLNPAFEASTNWATVAMHDDGLDGDAAAGDHLYSVILPPQAHRCLVRYRITVTDTFGASRRAPFEDDPSLNFAYFVYDGIPAYEGCSAEVLESLPVYWLITRDADMTHCTAWLNGGDQLPQDLGGVRNAGRLHYNWEGALVYEGVVYDHVTYRLRGANGRYHNGKRSFRIRFRNGHYLEARDQDGNLFPKKWQGLTTGKGQSNRGSESFGLNEVINYFLWNKVGVPSPSTFHFHFRVVRGGDETNRYQGDFWGLNWAQEEYDIRFLEAHNLPKGNLYKLVDNYVLGLEELRYQGPLAVTNAADFFNIENGLTGSQSREWLEAHAHYPNWYHYHAVAEAVRQYDVWPSCNKNGAWYFEPVYTTANNQYGRMWLLPYDGTDTWGPTWNGGQDVLHNGIFNDSGVSGGDTGQNLAMQMEYRNVVRNLRDLLFQPDQIHAVIDAFAGPLQAFAPADMARWLDAPAPARYLSLGIPTCPGVTGGLPAYVRDLKDFMFVGGTHAWWIDRNSVSAGGWVTRLDTLAADAAVPTRPTLTYIGAEGYPLDGLVFQSSAFADPQGPDTFGAIQWRVAQVLDPGTVPTHPAQLRLEYDAAWVSEPLPTFNAVVTVPGHLLQPYLPHRARVRHRDNTGRWSHWSPPFEFRPGWRDLFSALRTNLVFNEVMYNPPGQGAIDGDEFEFVELKNIGASTLDLGGLYFTGITFVFTNGTTLAPGATFLAARNPAVLATRYPGAVPDGDYSDKLNNDGETIELRHPVAGEILSFEYSDRAPWPVAADGFGFSLVRAADGSYRASAAPLGTPGADGGAGVIGGIVVNEVLSSSTLPLKDTLELWNAGADPVDLSGWYLTDDPTYPWKFRIPARPALAPGEFAVFDEDQFNPAPGTGTGFSLSALGDDAYVFSADASGQLTGYSHGFTFGGARDGVSFGRHLNSVGDEQFPAQIARTPGTANAGPRIGPVVISEIHYHPFLPADEFLELENISGTNVALFDPAILTNTWRLGGAAFTFPTLVTLDTGGRLLLVADDPASFRARFAVPAAVGVCQYPGALQNGGELLELLAPDAPAGTNDPPYYAVDAVRYNDRKPWPLATDGAGASLQRSPVAVYGNDPAAWVGATPTPGRPAAVGTPPVFTAHPVSQTNLVGMPAGFSASAAGTPPLFYQWRFNGGNLEGATNATLTLASVQLADAGVYQAVVYNAAGATDSLNATLTVRVGPFITSHPASVTNSPGQNTTFTVVASGAGSLAYQWQHQGTNLPGATSASYTVTNAQFDVNDGYYRVIVTDLDGSRPSGLARLTVRLRPAIPAGQDLTVTPNLYHPTNGVVDEGRSFTLTVSADGCWPISYRFRAPGNQYFAVLVYDTNHSTATLVVDNANPTNAGLWDVGIVNAGGSVLTRKIKLTVMPAPPFFALHPTSQESAVGDDLLLASEARGTGPIAYQWFFNGTTPIPDATNATLSLSNIQAAAFGDYVAVASNHLGIATSEVAQVT
ncbi:MAG: lamin tail domain-containing protein, partial [Verrucomicrobia bacterium]|nr:lamin tail domain-containing protein [Verrucomicrobiota bacterium]